MSLLLCVCNIPGFKCKYDWNANNLWAHLYAFWFDGPTVISTAAN